MSLVNLQIENEFEVTLTRSEFCVGNLSGVLRPNIKKMMKAQILVMEELTVPIIRGSQVLLHMHCLDFPAIISNIISKVNK